MSKKNKLSKKNQKIIIGITVLVIAFILVLFGANEQVLNEFENITGVNTSAISNLISSNSTEETNNTTSNSNVVTDGSELKVYFIDVGQADSILIINNNEAMLIDAGNNEDGENVVNFIKSKGISKLNYVVGTHPHEDHIGGLDTVIDNIDVEQVLMPKMQTNTKTFESVLDSVANKNLSITAPSKGDNYKLGETSLEVMNDSIEDSTNLNLSSIILRLTFGNNSFLFMGDAETKNENTRDWPETDVLKVGHHGSTTSSSQSFLNQVKPKYSIIMVGVGNSYNLPKAEIINKLQSLGSKIYRTDENGTIEATSNGNNIEFVTEK